MITASRSGGRRREPLVINATTNSPPVGHGCRIKPKQGYAGETRFMVICASYYDEDLPMNYTLWVEKEGAYGHCVVITLKSWCDRIVIVYMCGDHVAIA